jgi:hypothetical protein
VSSRFQGLISHCHLNHVVPQVLRTGSPGGLAPAARLDPTIIPNVPVMAARRVPPRKTTRFTRKRKHSGVISPDLEAESGTEGIAPAPERQPPSLSVDSERSELHHCPFHCGAEGFGSVPDLERHLRVAYCDTADDKHRIRLLDNDQDRTFVFDTLFGCGSAMIAHKEKFGKVPDLSCGHGILGSDGQGSRKGKGGRSQPSVEVPSITLLLIPPPDASPPVKN